MGNACDGLIMIRVKDCGFNFQWKLFGMTIADCESLASCLLESTVMTTLKKLDIQSSGIDDTRTRMLCRVLMENSCLQTLDFSHNSIGKGGARGIAKLLSSPASRIAHLSLSNNKMGRDGIVSISKALSMEHGKNTRLKTLNIALNDLTDDGGATLFEDLIQNSTLEVLDVSANNLGQESALAMAKYIRTHHSDGLHTISASCNRFADKVDINAKSSEEIGKLLLDCMNMNKVSLSHVLIV
jgi:Ran GTPase-activating protein (RanGAP) involved in mRNA processing and transport